MAYEYQFDLFRDDAQGPLWQRSFIEFEEAKRQAQEMADDQGYEFFIFDCTTSSEVARVFPARRTKRV